MERITRAKLELPAGYNSKVEGIMKKTKRGLKLVPALSVASIGLLLAGCSGGADPNDPNAQGGETQVADSVGVVDVYGRVTGTEAELLEKSWADWSEENGIKIRYTGDKNFESQLGIKVQGGDTPDLAVFPQPGLLEATVASGKVQKLPEGAQAEVGKNWSEDWQNYGKVDGVQYGAPLMASVKGYIWYSPKQFEEWGVSVPKTWDEMTALGTEITKKTDEPAWCAGFASGEASGWPGTDWIEDAVLRQSGTEAYDKWVSGELEFTSPEITSAFDSVGEILLDPKQVNAGYGDVKSINATAFGDIGTAVAKGTCPLTHQASFLEGFILDAKNADGETPTVAPDGDVWAFIAPQFNEGDPTSVVGGGEFVAAFSNDEDTAKVQEYLASADWANSRVKLGGVISANSGLDPENASSDLLRSAVELLQDPSTTFRFDGSDLMPKSVGADSFWKGIVDWIDGKPTKEVLENIQAGYDS